MKRASKKSKSGRTTTITIGKKKRPPLAAREPQKFPVGDALHSIARSADRMIDEMERKGLTARSIKAVNQAYVALSNAEYAVQDAADAAEDTQMYDALAESFDRIAAVIPRAMALIEFADNAMKGKPAKKSPVAPRDKALAREVQETVRAINTLRREAEAALYAATDRAYSLSEMISDMAQETRRVDAARNR